MIICYSRKFLMFMPWKTASSTMGARLKPFNESPYSAFYAFSPHLNRVVHQHITCAEFQAFPESRQDFFIGSFVRNPYDRVYSGFLQLQRDIQGQPGSAYPADWVRALVKRQLADNLAQLFRADYDFDRWLDSVTEDQVYEVGRNTSFPLHPAHYWTHLDGKPYAAFIGRVENFEADLDAFCRRVGIDSPDRTNRNVSEEAPPPADRPYRHIDRMSRRSLDRINQLFRDDFDLFHYAKI